MLGSGGRTALPSLSLVASPFAIAHIRRTFLARARPSAFQEKSPTSSGTLFLVAVVHSNWNHILAELSRWKELSRGGKLFAYFTAQNWNLS